MDGLLPDDVDSDEFVPSSSDPVLPISHSLPEFNTPNGYYHHHHRSDYHELVDGFSRLQLSPPSLLSPPPSSIPSSSSFHPLSQLWNIPSRGYGFLLETDIYSTPQPRWDSEFLMPPRSPRVNVMRGNTASIANNPTWCNFFKYLLSKGRPEDIARSFSVVSKNTAAVMVDVYGSSLFQKLLDVCSPGQRSELFDATVADLNRLLDICCSDYGTMAMTKLLHYCHTRNQIWRLMHASRPYLLDLAKHEHGNRIVERCLSYFSCPTQKALLDPLFNNWKDLAKHKFGCYILQQALDLVPREDRNCVLAKIANNALDLAWNSSGNYLVQHVLYKRIPHITYQILRRLEGNFASLSIQKYSSNVVEQCLKYTEETESTKIINELLQSPNVLGILEDMYGNYVIQTALFVAKAFLDSLLNNWEDLAKHKFGCHILQQALDLVPSEDRNRILAKKANDALGLARDSLGNYLVQYVLYKRIPHITYHILRQLEENFASLSIQKYSSNVIEKCLQYTEEAKSTKIINELLQNPNVLRILEDREVSIKI